MRREEQPSAEGGDDLRRIVEFLTSQRASGKRGELTARASSAGETEQLPWTSRDLELVLPIVEAQAMWERAQKLGVETGGRFDVRLGAVIIHAPAAVERARPIGAFYVRWGVPGDAEATVCTVEWDPRHDGAEDAVWQAIELLAGRPLRRASAPGDS